MENSKEHMQTLQSHILSLFVHYLRSKFFYRTLSKLFTKTEEMKKAEVYVDPNLLKELVIGNATYRSAYDFRETKRDLEIARRDLGETEEKKINCLKKLKKMLCDDKNFHYITDDDFLIRFLRVKKYKCDMAFKAIREHFQVRKDYPEAFSLPSNLQNLLQADFHGCYPYVDQEGRLIYKVDLGNLNTSEISFVDFMRTMVIIANLTTANPTAHINGIVAILDLKGLSTSHLALLVPWRISMMMKCLLKCCPRRVKLIIGVNSGKLGTTLYRILKPFINIKQVERVIVLGSDMNELHQYINPDLIPKQFGGKLEDNKFIFPQHVLNNLNYLKNW